MSAWRTRSRGVIAAGGATVALAACGSGARQDVHEPQARFAVAVSTASFPSSQTLSEHTHLVLAVRNAGQRTIPDVAVTICNVTCAYPAPQGEGSSTAAFAANSAQQYLANPARPIWVVDRGPGHCGYSCRGGGPGSAASAYANTWALGPLPPGRTARFDWAVTAVSPGHHVVAWQLAAGLNGRARAVLGDGSPPHGSFNVQIDAAAPKSYVNANGQIVTQ